LPKLTKTGKGNHKEEKIKNTNKWLPFLAKR
jgi:hypothetical protein